MTEEIKAGNPEPSTDLMEQVVEALHSVYDPEIPVNIYDLGLIYNIDLSKGDGNKHNLLVEMTLTTANCPLADMIPGMVHDALTSKIPDLNEVEVRLVWEPPWDPSRMSEEARFELDMY